MVHGFITYLDTSITRLEISSSISIEERTQMQILFIRDACLASLLHMSTCLLSPMIALAPI